MSDLITVDLNFSVINYQHRFVQIMLKTCIVDQRSIVDQCSIVDLSLANERVLCKFSMVE